MERTWDISSVKSNFVLTKNSCVTHIRNNASVGSENIKPDEDHYLLNRLGNDYYSV